MSKTAINEGYTGFSMKSTPLPQDDLEYIFKNDSEEETGSDTEAEISKKSESKKPDKFKKPEKPVLKTSKDKTKNTKA